MSTSEKEDEIVLEDAREGSERSFLSPEVPSMSMPMITPVREDNPPHEAMRFELTPKLFSPETDSNQQRPMDFLANTNVPTASQAHAGRDTVNPQQRMVIPDHSGNQAIANHTGNQSTSHPSIFHGLSYIPGVYPQSDPRANIVVQSDPGYGAQHLGGPGQGHVYVSNTSTVPVQAQSAFFEGANRMTSGVPQNTQGFPHFGQSQSRMHTSHQGYEPLSILKPHDDSQTVTTYRSVTRPPPEFDGTEYASYRKRLFLWHATTKIHPSEVAPLIYMSTKGLAKTVLDSANMSVLLDSRPDPTSPELTLGVATILRLFDENFHVEHYDLPHIAIQNLWAFKRKPNEDWATYITEFQSKVREVLKTGQRIESPFLSFLFLENCGINDDDKKLLFSNLEAKGVPFHTASLEQIIHSVRVILIQTKHSSKVPDEDAFQAQKGGYSGKGVHQGTGTQAQDNRGQGNWYGESRNSNWYSRNYDNRPYYKRNQYGPRDQYSNQNQRPNREADGKGKGKGKYRNNGYNPAKGNSKGNSYGKSKGKGRGYQYYQNYQPSGKSKGQGKGYYGKNNRYEQGYYAAAENDHNMTRPKFSANGFG